jgi:hypothetical protein
MLRPSYPEKTNLYLTNLNNKSKIEVLIPDGVLKCEESYEDFFINVIQFNTFHNFYHVIEGYNNNFNIIIDNSENIICSIPEGNITAYTIRDYFNNHEILKNGQDMLVSLSNAKLVNKTDIIDYINENIDLKRYLEKITWRYYIKNVNENRDNIVDNIVDKFIEYVRSGLISYKLVGKERLYTAQELTRFKKEYLSQLGSKL